MGITKAATTVALLGSEAWTFVSSQQTVRQQTQRGLAGTAVNLQKEGNNLDSSLII